MSILDALSEFGFALAILAGVGLAAGTTWCVLVYVLPKRKPKAQHPYFLTDDNDSWRDK